MSDGVCVALAVLCLVVATLVVAPTMAQSPTDSITGVELSGSAAVPTDTNTTYLWQDESLNLSVTVANTHDSAHRNYRVCPYQVGDTDHLLLEKPEDCPRPSLDPGSTQSVTFSGLDWPADASGAQQLRIDLELVSTDEQNGPLAQRTLPVTVIEKGGDLDNDGLVNSKDVGVGLDTPDTDGDGLSDGMEVNQAHTKPENPDTDGDGLSDGAEINRYGTDPKTTDTDGDGLADGVEVNTLGTNPNDGLTPVWLVLVGLVVLALVVLLISLWRRARRDTGATAQPESSDRIPPGDEGENVARSGHDAQDGHDRDDAQPRAPPAESGATPPSANPVHPTPRPLTDEDHVLELLHERGGRMKQATIVEETEWSKAKVSRLLSSMDDADQIEKLSIGRENIISLDGHGPAAARSSEE